MTTQTPRPANRLAHETSPYLRQHAHNPVDWYPWGPEAFAKATAEDKPLFVSIGYSTCHWCHVMERESFEDADVGAYLNERFVCIKVDREERPDLDQVYMTFTQAFLGGGGGWPMSVWCTPEGRPFFAGTYFPPEDRYGRPGFRTACEHVLAIWRTKRPEVERMARGEVPKLFEEPPRPDRAELDASIGREAAQRLAAHVDRPFGGWGGPGQAPKFPTPHQLTFLLREHRWSGDAALLDAVVVTLDGMARGGIHDHVGGGFHRYSTDRHWLVPHFEKMLYDQAGLLQAYAEAFQVTGEPRFAEVARGIVAYVRRDLRDARGGFFSAEDADSEGEEGKFYVWTRDELLAVLGAADGAEFAEVYRCRADGNWRDEATGHAPGSNIVHRAGEIPPARAAALAAMRAKLLATRSTRVRPLLDDKVITAWNGMMIGALARAGRALGEPAWLDAAAAAARFVLTTHRRADGRLLRSSRHGAVKDTPGYVEDYAFLAGGLLDLYEATGDASWLAESAALARAMPALFGRDGGGLLYLTGADAEALIARPVDTHDGATPSGNSAAALVCLRLGRLLADASLASVGEAVLRHMSEPLRVQGLGYTAMLQAADLLLRPTREIVLAGDRGSPALAALRAEVDRRFLPEAVVAVHFTGAEGTAARALMPFIEPQGPVEGKAAAYVCSNYACQAPVTTPAALAALLAKAQ